MNISTTIFSYGGGLEISKRHLSIWKKYTDNLMIISPEDSPCILQNVECITYEKSNKFGLPMLKRQLFGMKNSLKYESDYHIFIEYDGIMLSKPKERNIIQANIFNDGGKEEYSSIYFHHFPWIFSQKILKDFCEKATFEPFNKGLVDRWLAGQLDKIKLDIFNLKSTNEGFSKNTIEPEHESDLYKAINNGAYAIHGIKNERILNEILRQRENYLNSRT